MAELTCYPDQLSDHGACECCGGTTRTVWGALREGSKERGVYVARFTFGHPERGAEILVSLGGWASDEDEDQRRAFGARGVNRERRPEWTWVDAVQVEWTGEPFLGRRLTAGEAAADADAESVEKILVMLGFQDERLRLFLTRDGRDARGGGHWLERAEARLQLGDDAEAVACATIALGLDPTRTEAFFLRGWARGRDGELVEGIQDLERYLEKAPRAKNAARASKIVKVFQKRLAEEG